MESCQKRMKIVQWSSNENVDDRSQRKHENCSGAIHCLKKREGQVILRWKEEKHKEMVTNVKIVNKEKQEN
jgi:hypothetical protein